MDKGYRIFLRHILESINHIENYTKNKNKKDFVKADILIQDGIIKRIEIIGEAIRNIPDSIKLSNPHIPWRDIVDMRNVLIHEYFGIDMDLVWKTINKDMPELKKDIIELLK